jgi:GxxExxY protein
MSELIYAEESYQILGACFHVYKTMGCGFLEAVYQECLEIEFRNRGISYLSQPALELVYQDHKLKQRYRADFICFEKIIVELKAVSSLCDDHCAQMLNYLHATGMKLGMLINFGHYPKLEHKRIALTKNSRDMIIEQDKE